MADYFNILEIKQILSLSKLDPYEAKLRYEEYLEKHPKDYSAYMYYTTILIAIGEIENAKKIINYVENTYKQDKNFLEEKSKVEYLEYNIVLNQLKILCLEEKHEEFYKLYLSKGISINEKGFDNVIYYVKQKLGILEEMERNTCTYVCRQIMEYQESDFQHHINRHLTANNSELDEEKSKFIEGFPIDEVLEEIKKYIPSDKKIIIGFFYEAYYFKYNYCGRAQNKPVDYFKVICFKKTSDFITIYPTDNCEYLPHVDLNYMINEKPKQKSLSQIEKFNKRYRRNKNEAII